MPDESGVEPGLEPGGRSPLGHPGSGDGRDESPAERLDRQFQDLLQELRVSQTGVQILFAFLLGIAFTPAFATISDWQRTLYVATLITTVLASILFIGPVSFARIVFRQRLRETLVTAGNWMAIAGLAFLMLSMTGAVLLVVSVVLGGTWAAAISGLLLVGFLLIWYALPMAHRWRGKHLHHG